MTSDVLRVASKTRQENSTVSKDGDIYDVTPTSAKLSMLCSIAVIHSETDITISQSGN